MRNYEAIIPKGAELEILDILILKGYDTLIKSDKGENNYIWEIKTKNRVKSRVYLDMNQNGIVVILFNPFNEEILEFIENKIQMKDETYSWSFLGKAQDKLL